MVVLCNMVISAFGAGQEEGATGHFLPVPVWLKQPGRAGTDTNSPFLQKHVRRMQFKCIGG
jgi:hypothetical protein